MSQHQQNIRSLTYFYSQVNEFRNLMGMRSFWANPDLVQKTKIALGHLYIQLVLSPEDNEKAVIAFDAVMTEYTHRYVLVASMTKQTCANS